MEYEITKARHQSFPEHEWPDGWKGSTPYPGYTETPWQNPPPTKYPKPAIDSWEAYDNQDKQAENAAKQQAIAEELQKLQEILAKKKAQEALEAKKKAEAKKAKKKRKARKKSIPPPPIHDDTLYEREV
jgi:hypothetical protein